MDVCAPICAAPAKHWSTKTKDAVFKSYLTHSVTLWQRYNPVLFGRATHSTARDSWRVESHAFCWPGQTRSTSTLKATIVSAQPSTPFKRGDSSHMYNEHFGFVESPFTATAIPASSIATIYIRKHLPICATVLSGRRAWSSWPARSERERQPCCVKWCAV